MLWTTKLKKNKTTTLTSPVQSKNLVYFDDENILSMLIKQSAIKLNLRTDIRIPSPDRFWKP